MTGDGRALGYVCPLARPVAAEASSSAQTAPEMVLIWVVVARMHKGSTVAGDIAPLEGMGMRLSEDGLWAGRTPAGYDSSQDEYMELSGNTKVSGNTEVSGSMDLPGNTRQCEEPYEDTGLPGYMHWRGLVAVERRS